MMVNGQRLMLGQEISPIEVKDKFTKNLQKLVVRQLLHLEQSILGWRGKVLGSSERLPFRDILQSNVMTLVVSTSQVFFRDAEVIYVFPLCPDLESLQCLTF